MKYFAITKFRTAVVETDVAGIILDGSTVFRTFVGQHITKLQEKFEDKKYAVRFVPIEEETNASMVSGL
jgi:hypothetical protein